MRSNNLRKKSFRRRSKSNKRRSKKRSSRNRKQRGGKRLATNPVEFAKGLTETRPLCAFGSKSCRSDRGITDAFQTNKIADILLRLHVEKPNMGKMKNNSSDADILNSQRASLISRVSSEAPAYIEKYCAKLCNAKNKKVRPTLLEETVRKFGEKFDKYIKRWKFSSANYQKRNNDIKDFVQKAENVLISNGFSSESIGYSNVSFKESKNAELIPNGQIKFWDQNEPKPWNIRSAVIMGWSQPHDTLCVKVSWHEGQESYYGPWNRPWGQSVYDDKFNNFLKFTQGGNQAGISGSLDTLEQGLKKAKGELAAPVAGPAVGGRKRSKRNRRKKRSKKRGRKKSKKRGRKRSKKRNY